MDRLVEGELPFHVGTLHDRDLAGVRDLPGFFLEVGRRIDLGVRLNETGIFEHLDLKIVGLFIFEGDVIIPICFDLGDECRKHGLVEADVHRKLLLLISGFQHHHCGGGSSTGKGGFDDQAGVFFDFDIAGGHRDLNRGQIGFRINFYDPLPPQPPGGCKDWLQGGTRR